MNQDTEKLKAEIESIANQVIGEGSLFLVGAAISQGGNNTKISLFVDGDEGVNIDQCAEISRKVNEVIEEKALIDHAYNLIVSSPGLDQPLTLPRQIKKNIGRQVKVKLNSGKDYTGELVDFKDNSVVIRYTSEKEEAFEMDNVDKILIVVSFK